VVADRVYFGTVAPASDSDADKIKFPDNPVELRIPLTGTEVRIGRRSVTKHIEPEIDLTGKPTDPGVSRLHAVLRKGPDHTWTVTDAGSPNGILVNGTEVPPGESMPLRHGDRIHLGFWTVITVTRDRTDRPAP
jgi:pSer/pThr/pTyr-binding forkhead associated (FHA) protein